MMIRVCGQSCTDSQATDALGDTHCVCRYVSLLQCSWSHLDHKSFLVISFVSNDSFSWSIEENRKKYPLGREGEAVEGVVKSFSVASEACHSLFDGDGH